MSEVYIENDDFELVKITNSALFELQMKDGTPLPDFSQMHGRFTKPSLAMKAVDRYLELEKNNRSIKEAEDKGVVVTKKQKERVEANAKK